MSYIRMAEKRDCLQVAEIHFQEIRKGFLNRLGKRFLYYFYEAMITSDNAFLLVVCNNNSVVGFVSGCSDLKRFYKDFFKKYLLKMFPIFLLKVFNPRVFTSIFETMRYSKKEIKDLPSAELLSIALNARFCGQGIASQLFESFVAEMKKRGIKRFRVIVGEDLKLAIRFYEAKGFKFHSRHSIHKNSPSLIYTYNI